MQKYLFISAQASRHNSVCNTPIYPFAASPRLGCARLPRKGCTLHHGRVGLGRRAAQRDPAGLEGKAETSNTQCRENAPNISLRLGGRLTSTNCERINVSWISEGVVVSHFLGVGSQVTTKSCDHG